MNAWTCRNTQLHVFQDNLATTIEKLAAENQTGHCDTWMFLHCSNNYTNYHFNYCRSISRVHYIIAKNHAYRIIECLLDCRWLTNEVYLACNILSTLCCLSSSRIQKWEQSVQYNKYKITAGHFEVLSAGEVQFKCSIMCIENFKESMNLWFVQYLLWIIW